MNIAIYSRKSRFTGKGESIYTQINLCKEYAQKNFDPIENFIIYEDEGFSGGNIDRPKYQEMIHDALKHKFQILICYRLDRISRNISDFSNTIQILQNQNIDFISLREQFDTSTPMGRAMMYMASVFAQLERETIAERIRDNMLELAKTGRWLGGVTPTGFISKSSQTLDKDGKTRKMFQLSPVPDELKIIKILYNQFLLLKSLTKLETYCIQNHIKTKNNIDFTRFSLKAILTNPVYATADQSLYDYFISHGFEVYPRKSDFDGKNGIMAYNKTFQQKHKTNTLKSPSEWIISIGTHPGIIPSNIWIRVQQLISQNKSKSFRKIKNTQALLSGILICNHCGSFMRPKMGRTKKNGEKAYYYICEQKEKSKRQNCNIKNLNGNELDQLVIESIQKLPSEASILYEMIKKNKVTIPLIPNKINSEIKRIQKNIKNKEKSIQNLVYTLSEGQNQNIIKYIMKQMNQLNEEIEQMKKKLIYLQEESKNTQIYKKKTLNNIFMNFSDLIHTLTISKKRKLIQNLIEKIKWDGEYVHIFFIGSNKSI
ncbi:recombinase family protein [Inediibacterium massiliense]|uniref:recombinase family protein n=1 Tax=Inediibacterium massiliense TaxID=1658111 RepID=UPI0006B62E72|nr:recombinase family protein [Inediibacterium massiliense]